MAARGRSSSPHPSPSPAPFGARAAAPDTAGPSSAKRQKIFRACASCVTSKTRCEDVTPQGCALCRRRARVCSLAAVASALEANGGSGGRTSSQTGTSSDSGRVRNGGGGGGGGGSGGVAIAHPSPLSATPAAPLDWPTGASASASAAASPADVDSLRHRLADAERRVARTEAALLELETQVQLQRDELVTQRQHPGYDRALDGDAHSNGHARALSISHIHRRSRDTDPVQVAGPLRLATISQYRLDESVFSAAATRVYPDPVARGVVPAAYAQLAWHAFKARISALLPLPPFLNVSTPLPEHGFVVLAALHHVPSEYSAALEPLLDESVLLAMSGAVSVDVILALLILSLAPFHPERPEDAARAPSAPMAPSGFRCISLAYQMGQNIGLEALAETAVRRGNDLNFEYYGEQLWNLQLWAAIVNRFSLLSLMSGQILQLPPRIAARLPVLARDSVEMCNRHLRLEAGLIDVFEPIARQLCTLQYADEYALDRLSEVHTSWRNATEQAKHFAAAEQPPPIQRDAVCIEFALGVRLASLTTWIPSPLKTARELAMSCLSRFPATMTQMLEMVTAEGHATADVSSFPSYTAMLATVSLICLWRAVEYVRITYHMSLVETTRLEAAETRLMAISRAIRFVLVEASRLNRLYDAMPARKWARGRDEAPLPPRGGATGAAAAVAAGDAVGAHAGDEQCCSGPSPDKRAPNRALHDPEDVGVPVAAAAAAFAAPFMLDFDVMNWDLSLLYPDLTPFPGIANHFGDGHHPDAMLAPGGEEHAHGRAEQTWRG